MKQTDFLKGNFKHEPVLSDMSGILCRKCGLPMSECYE